MNTLPKKLAKAPNKLYQYSTTPNTNCNNPKNKFHINAPAADNAPHIMPVALTLVPAKWLNTATPAYNAAMTKIIPRTIHVIGHAYIAAFIANCAFVIPVAAIVSAVIAAPWAIDLIVDIVLNVFDIPCTTLYPATANL